MANLSALSYGDRYETNGYVVVHLPMTPAAAEHGRDQSMITHAIRKGSAVPPTIEAGINIDRQGGRTSVYDPDSALITEPMVDIDDARAHGRVWRLEPFLYERYHVTFTSAVNVTNPENEDQVGAIIAPECEREQCRCADAYHEPTGDLTRRAGTRGNVKAMNGSTTKLLHPFSGDGSQSLPVRRGHYRMHPSGHGDHPIAAATTPNVNETLSLELLAEAEAQADAEADE